MATPSSCTACRPRNYKVFLDFDGHTTTGTSWNSYFGASTFYSPAFSIDACESFNADRTACASSRSGSAIAEYFSPFNIDVTTEDPGVAGLTYSGAGDTAFGIRVVITDEGGKNYGGLGYVGSFDWNSDTPVFVYANPLGDSVEEHRRSPPRTRPATRSASATTGRAPDELLLRPRQRRDDWAPVMGVGYNASIVQWSKGEYTSATQTQDDLAIITTQNSGVELPRRRPRQHLRGRGGARRQR